MAVAGLVFARDGLRARLNPGWAGAAGLAAYVLYMLPVIAYGHWTWSGYDFVNDSAFEMLLAQHIKGFGTALGEHPREQRPRVPLLLSRQRATRSARRRCWAPSAA